MNQQFSREYLTMLVLDEVEQERDRQESKWGEQDHPDGTGGSTFRFAANDFREACQDAFARGDGTYRHILAEEVYEAFSETNQLKLRAELIQVAAVAVAWVEKIDREASR